VRLLPPAKASTRIQVGQFVRARVVAAQGHDLIAEPL
jgi:ribosomal protein S12 methylthiotransferase